MGNHKNCDMLETATYSISTDNTRKVNNGLYAVNDGTSLPNYYESLRPLNSGAGRTAQIQWSGNKNREYRPGSSGPLKFGSRKKILSFSPEIKNYKYLGNYKHK